MSHSLSYKVKTGEGVFLQVEKIDQLLTATEKAEERGAELANATVDLGELTDDEGPGRYLGLFGHPRIVGDVIGLLRREWK